MVTFVNEQPLMGKTETNPPYIVAEKLGWKKERETIDGDNEKKICNNVIIM